MNKELLYPASLWIGSEEYLLEHTLSFLKRVLCKKQACGECFDCGALGNKRHYSLLWLSPENYYTIAQLEIVFKTVSFALNAGEHFFIIFERADCFNGASANSLLKALEEPPAGYHFILLAQRIDAILPTIKSRCIIEQFSHNRSGLPTKTLTHKAGTQAIDQEPLSSKGPLYLHMADYFTLCTYERAADFHKELDRSQLKEREVLDLLDSISQYWHDQLTQSSLKNDVELMQRSLQIIEILKSARTHTAMPGSAKLFLKNLYLSFSLAF